MDKDIIEKTKKITSMISHLYGWYFEAEKTDEEDEITISYEQGVDDAGIPGNILKIEHVKDLMKINELNFLTNTISLDKYLEEKNLMNEKIKEIKKEVK